MPAPWRNVHRYAHGIAQRLGIGWYALPVFRTHMNLCIHRAGQLALGDELAQVVGQGRAKVHRLLSMVKLAHDG